MDLAIANFTVIHPQTPVVVVEGNYLLLKTSPGSSLRDVFSATIFIRPSLGVLEQRLMQRWVDHGLDANVAKRKVTGNDLPNAKLVLSESHEADFLVN